MTNIQNSGPSYHRDSPLQTVHRQQLAAAFTQVGICHPWSLDDHPRRIHPWKSQQGSHIAEITRYPNVAYCDSCRHPDEHFRDCQYLCRKSCKSLSAQFAYPNMSFQSYMFRSKDPYITAREVRAYGPQAPAKSSPYITASPSTARTRRSFHLGRSASDTLPSYHARTGSRNQSRNISAPVATGDGQPGGLGFYGEKDGAIMEGGVHQPPVVGNVQRPDLAHHPAYNNVRPASSVYTSDQLRHSAWVQN